MDPQDEQQNIRTNEGSDQLPQPEPEKHETQPSSPVPRKSKHKKLYIVVGCVFVAVVIALVWFLILNKSEDKKMSDNDIKESAKAEVARFGVAVGLVEATAEYSQDKGRTWQKLTTETDLKEGTQVKTGADGRIVLLIDDGSAVRLDFNSSVELSSLATNSVTITSLSGELYNRVVPANSRTYQVVAGDQAYIAKGTAFRTFNLENKKGVEVYQSSVAVKDKEANVAEGNAFFSLNDQKEKENVVTAIDIALLRSDDFIKWNSEQDKKNAEFAKNRGVLAELDKPAPVVAAPTQTTPQQKNGITLSGRASEFSAVFSWKTTGINVSKGYKLVRSATSQTPTYPKDSTAFIESGKTSYSLYVGDGKTYYYRICAYRGDTCDSYSNTVTITTASKPKEQVVAGAVTLTLSGTQASWTFAGTAPYGFKLVMSTSPSPTYPSMLNKYTEGTSTSLPEKLTSGTTYYVRVCKYNDGNCTDYSNEVQYVAP